MRFPVVIDFETKNSFRQVVNHSALEISVAGIYDYSNDEMNVYDEADLNKLIAQMEKASLVIGFNSEGFDLPVLQRYYPGDITQFKSFDILSDIKRLLGRRISLNDIVKATLNQEKSGHGLQAISLFKEGKIDELKQYCADDVRLTKELFDFGVKNNSIFYPTPNGPQKLYVSWSQYMEDNGNDTDLSLTLPF